MYSFFSDPRLTQGNRRRQDRQDFFPAFSDSLFFDPFSYHQNDVNDNDDDDVAGEEYPFSAGQPQKHRQRRRPRHQQQQHQHQYEQQPQQPQQQQEEPEEMEEQQPMAEQPRHESAQRRHQHQQRKQHQQPQTQNPQTQQAGDGSKRRNRRQRRREKKGFSISETPTTQVPLMQARNQQPHADDIQSLDETTFGDKISLSDTSPVAKRPASSVPISSQRSYAPEYEDRSNKDTDQDVEADHDEDQYQEYDEEEEAEDVGDDFAEDAEEDQMAPDLEQQQKSWSELSEIDSDLDKLSDELNQIVTGVIPNKKMILMTEENLIKVMLRVDSVESGGDDAIRKQRKALIAKTERLLAKVDEFKQRTKTSAYYPRN
ncbi:hypothetical protein BGZ51_001142 [Haplosporangium sp. Z 767]|nr:hypothetical protein BGZ51_001142 [Haplosporangium sp. Z 767]KAF9190663.1 hypothetical protein BGZ50_000125 [Haplosporangium sp. Z 11]